MSGALFGPKFWDKDEREEVRRHHRTLWEDVKREWGIGTRDRIEWIPGLRESIERLLEQDYSLADISVFFGLSGERMCQIADELAIRERVRGGRGRSEDRSSHRVFDWKRLRFVAVDDPRGFEARLRRARKGAERRAEVLRREDATRAAITSLAARLGRPPVGKELAIELVGECDQPWPRLLSWLSRGRESFAITRERVDQLYLDCGFVRPDGRTRTIEVYQGVKQVSRATPQTTEDRR